MIEHADIDQRQRIAQAVGDQFVGLAGFRDARGMIVREDHRRCIAAQRLLDDLAGMDARAIDRAAEQLNEGDEPVAIV